jgi:hypothetical protein
MAAKRRKGQKPSRGKSAHEAERHHEGPAEWLLPMMEEAYTRLRPKDEPERPARVPAGPPRAGVRVPAFSSVHRAGKGEEVLADLPLSYWEDVLREYQRRKHAAAGPRPARRSMVIGMPVVPGANNWTPIGPSVISRGQTLSRAAISGRIAGIAIAPGGARMYVATANGGVWRSDDSGRSWQSTMDGFDTNPTAFAAASLCCGAIAIDPADPDRVYVGTGEGDTDAIFAFRLVNALPTYRGIGPILSDDGGLTWVQESSSPSLAGFSFYQIAVDPADREHCVAATTNGLYERVPSGGGFTWTQRQTGIHTSVIVTSSGGTTRWFAAKNADVVYTSTDGNSWTAVGTGFPAGIARIALGAQPDNPNVLYAVIVNTSGGLHSVRRLDGVAGAWKNVSGTPPLLPGQQGDYDICIAVDPNNANRIYLGGDYFDADPFPGSIWRGDVSPSGTAFSMTTASIGQNAHADVHVLKHVPGDSNQLFTGTDGGLFLNTNPTAGGVFQSRNTGLATLCTNFIGQHPTEPAVVFAGLQDNGTARCTGEAVWRHVLFADGGYGVVNWNDPFRVILFANGNLFLATDGGQGYTTNAAGVISLGSWSIVTPPGSSSIMAAPVVGTPVNTASPAQADIVAFGGATRIHISTNFGTSWPTTLTLPAGTGNIFAMVFASATRLYAGTTNGSVFRADNVAGTWSLTRLDDVVAGPLPLNGLITDIAVDTSDATLGSIYVCFGGAGDFRHVWRFNGTSWQARSGTAGSGTELLDVEHNAIQYDAVTNRVYVGANIGVWESADGGNIWNPLQNGLPDAPVYDLQIHPGARVLRACLHGGGLFEWKLDAPRLPDVELYVRDTVLDTARDVNTDGRNDPSVFPTAAVYHYLSPNIKVDVPTPAGYQTPTTDIDFLSFNETIVDGSNGVGTNSPPPTVHNRVYVEVHNRGRVDATSVQVMAVVTNAATGLALPAGYTANIQAGTPLPGPKWITLGVVTIPVVRAGFPRVVHFDLPSTVLPMPASLPGNSHWCMLAFVHAAQDGFTSTIPNADALTLADRKVGQKNLHLVEFVGTPPAPGTGPGVWAMLLVRGVHFKESGRFDLVIDGRGFPGTLLLALPPPLLPAKPAEQVKGLREGSAALVKRWIDGYTPVAKRLFHEAKYPEDQYKLLSQSMTRVAGQTPLALSGGAVGEIRGLPIKAKDEFALFVRVDPPRGAKVGSAWQFDIQQRDSANGRLLGGSRYSVVVNGAVRG